MSNRKDCTHRIQDYDLTDYASVWGSRKRQYIQELEKYIINKAIRPSNDKRAVDLGCGFGRLSAIYLKKYKKVVLFDYSRKLLCQAVERYGQNHNVAFIQGDAYNLPFKDNSFDTIIMVRLFHHLESPQRALSEVKRILKKRGDFLFTFYNKYDFRSRIRSFFGLRKSILSKDDHENVSPDNLLYISNPLYVDRLLTQHSFNIKARYGIGLFIGRLLKYSKASGFIERYLCRISGRLNLTIEIIIHADSR